MPFLVGLLIVIYSSIIMNLYITLASIFLAMYATTIIIADPFKSSYKYLSINMVWAILLRAFLAISFLPIVYYTQITPRIAIIAVVMIIILLKSFYVAVYCN